MCGGGGGGGGRAEGKGGGGGGGAVQAQREAVIGGWRGWRERKGKTSFFYISEASAMAIEKMLSVARCVLPAADQRDQRVCVWTLSVQLPTLQILLGSVLSMI